MDDVHAVPVPRNESGCRATSTKRGTGCIAHASRGPAAPDGLASQVVGRRR